MRKLQGKVVSDKMDKTVVVEVERVKKHPKYHKRFRRHTKYKAHDAENQYREGDRVMIAETKPMSRQKRWRVVELIERPQAVVLEEQAAAAAEEVQEDVVPESAE